MKKTRKKQGFWAASAVFFVLFCTTCKGSVGLGGTVDIDRPTISVESPPMKAVVRNSFTLKGKLKDDIGVTKVTVTISGPGLEKAEIKDAPFDNASGTWSVVLNQPQANRFPLKDGTYTFQIQAVDGTGKEGTVETKFDIDNTPPLLVLTRPSTLVTDKNVDIFGDVFSLEGQVADSSGVSQLSIAAKDQGKEAVISLSNVPPTIRTKVDSFSADISPFYRELYGQVYNAGEKSFSYKLEIADGAKEYESPHSDKRKNEGNRTGVYYLYDDMYELLKHYTVEDLYTYLSGKSDIGSASRAVSAGIPKTLTQLTDFLSGKAVDTSTDYRGTFSLNPSKDPRFNIEGFNPFSLTGTANAHTVYDDAPLTIKLAQNLDKVPFHDVDSYQLYVIESETYRTFYDNNTFDINTSQLNPAHFIQLPPVEKKKQGGSYIINAKITKQLQLKYGKTYLLQVKGTDIENNPLRPEQPGYYGFKLEKIGRPVVRITHINGTEGGGSTKQVFVGKDQPITLKTALENSNLARVTYKLADIAEKSIELTKGTHNAEIFAAAVFAGKGGGVYPLEVRAEDAESGTAIPQNYQIYYDPDPPVLTKSVPYDGYIFNEPLTITGSVSDLGAGVDLNTFTASYSYTGRNPPISNTPASFRRKDASWELDSALFTNEGTYTLTFNVSDTLGQAMQAQTLRFTYDTAAPRITEIFNLSRDRIDTGEVSSHLSYPARLTGKIAETNKIEWIKCGPKGETLTELTSSEYTSESGGYAISYPIRVDADGIHEYTVRVRDMAGKEDEVTVKICADTTPPVFTTMKIAGQGFKTENTTQFTQPGEVITSSSTVSVKGAFTDDGSGIEKAVARYKESPSDTQLKEVEFTPRFENGTYTIDGSISLPLGPTLVRVTVYDKVGKTAVWNVNVTVENSALDLRLGIEDTSQEIQNDPVYMNTAFSLTVQGTYSGSTPESLELTVTKNGAGADLTGFYTDTTPADDINVAGNKITGFKSGSRTEPAKKYAVRFNPRNASHQDDGRYVFTLKSARSAVEKKYVVMVDTAGPVITPVYPQGGDIIDPTKPLKAAIFDDSGEIREPNVHYTYKEGSEQSVNLIYNAVSGAYEYTFPSAAQKEGKYTIRFSAKDRLGHLTATSTITGDYDTAAPVLTDISVNGKTDKSLYIKKGEPAAAITGTFIETNGIKSIGVYKTGESSALGTAAVTEDTASTGAGSPWSINLAVPATLGEGSHQLTIKAVDMADKTAEEKRTIIVDQTLPTFTVTHLAGKDISANNFASVFTSGTFIRNGAQNITYSTSDSGSGIDYVEYTFTGTSLSTDPKRFETHSGTASIHVPPSATGLMLTCADKAGNTTVHTLSFKVDAEPPKKPTVQKVGGKDANAFMTVTNQADLRLEGTAKDSDGGSGLQQIKWTLKPTDGSAEQTGSTTGTIPTTGEWSCAIPEEKITDGTLMVSAVDMVGYESAPSVIVLSCDNTPPTANILNFGERDAQTGTIVVKGTISDTGTAGVDPTATQWRIVKNSEGPITLDNHGPDSEWKKVNNPGASSWEISELSLSGLFTKQVSGGYTSEYAEPDPSAQDLFILPVYLSVKDRAGNPAVITLKILVDPDGNKPVVSIIGPAPEDPNLPASTPLSVGGSVSVYGSARVKVGSIEKVYMDVSTDPTFGSFVSVWHNKELEGTANWYTTLNKDNEIQNLIPSDQDFITVYYRLRAKNKKGTDVYGGYTETRALRFEKDAPIIENVRLYTTPDFDPPPPPPPATPPEFGTMYTLRHWVKGNDYYLGMRLKDSSGIKEVQIKAEYVQGSTVTQHFSKTLSGKTDGGTNEIADYEHISGTKTFKKTEQHGDFFDYDVRIPIQTNGLDGTEYIVTVTITEGVASAGSQHKSKTQSFTLRFDNTPPNGAFGAYRQDGRSSFSGTALPANIENAAAGMHLFVDNRVVDLIAGAGSTVELNTAVSGVHEWVLFEDALYLKGKKAKLQGIAYDTGDSEVKKIISVTLKKDGGVQKFKKIQPAGTTAADSDTIPTYSSGTDPSFTEESFTVEGNKYLFRKNGFFTEWVAPVDVSALPDGKYEVSYIVEDGAGNRSASLPQTVYVKNNELHLSKIFLGTDLNMSSSIEPFEKQPFGFSSENQNRHTFDWSGEVDAQSFTFKSANHGCISVEYTGGNGALNYELKKGSELIVKGSLLADKISLDNTALSKLGTGQVTLDLTLTDSTLEDPPGTPKGWTSSARITCNVNTNDTVPPVAAVLPLFWNAAGEGRDSLVWGEDETSTSTPKPIVAKGHISHEGKGTPGTGAGGTTTVTYSGTPAVSGKIKLHGYVYDDRVIDTVTVTIAKGSDSASATSTFLKNPVNAWTEGTDPSPLPNGSSPNLKLSVKAVKIDQTGHYAFWTLEWDTSSILGAVGEGVTVSVVAHDMKRNTSQLTHAEQIGKDTGTTQDTNRPTDTTLVLSDTHSAEDLAKVKEGQTVRLYDDSVNAYYVQITAKNDKTLTLNTGVPRSACKYTVYTNTAGAASGSYTVDVVPYVTGIKTALSKLGGTNDPDLYARTATGRYPVQDKEKIEIHGFNLTGAAVTVGGVASGSLSGTTSPWSLTLADGAKSGALELTVTPSGGSAVKAVNNINNNEKPYNKAKKTASNDKLTDDLFLDVWQFNSKAALPGRGVITEPVMRINPSNGMIGFAFANGPDFFSMSDGTSNSYTKWQRNYDDFGNVDFVYDSEGVAHGLVVGRDINSNSNHGGKFVYVTSKWGTGNTWDQNGNYGGHNSLRLEAIGQQGTIQGGSDYILDKTRIQHPSLAAAATSESGKPRLYLAYYDGINDQIRFRYGTNDKGTKGAFGHFNDQENQDAVTAYNQYNVSIVAGEYRTSASGATPITTGNTGNTTGTYLSLGVVTVTATAGSPPSQTVTDTAVLIWFDETSRMLKYTYKTNPQNGSHASQSGTGSGNWKKPIDVFDKMNVGEYCKIVVDKAGGIHIAAFDSDSADLKYAYLSSYNAASFQTATVDSYGITGTHITLDVAYTAADGKPVPYIGYYSASAGRSKLAYLVDTATGVSGSAQGTDSNGYFTGKWEVSVVPTASRVQQDNINVGVWKTADGVIKNSVIGTNSSGTDNGTVHGNGTANPVLGYAIRQAMNGYIETAQKK